MALKTNLPDDQVAEAAQRIQSGESWKAVAAAYQVDRCDLSRHFRFLGLDYRRRFYKCQGRKLTVPAEPTVLAYLAGLLDGEGNISSQEGKWWVAITNSYRPVIDWLLTFGGKDRAMKRYKPAHSPCWHWRIHAQQDVLAFLEAVAPYMIIKRDLAECVIAEIGHRPYRRPNPSTILDAK